MNRLAQCRRHVVTSLAIPMRAWAQQSDSPIVGVLSPILLAQFTPNFAAILRGLRAAGLGIAPPPTPTILARADELIEVSTRRHETVEW